MKKVLLIAQLWIGASALFAQDSMMSQEQFMRIFDPALFEESAKDIPTDDLHKRIGDLDSSYFEYKSNYESKGRLNQMTALINVVQNFSERFANFEKQTKALVDENNKLKSDIASLKEEARLSKIYIQKNLKSIVQPDISTAPIDDLKAYWMFQEVPDVTVYLKEALKKFDMGRAQFLASTKNWKLEVLFDALHIKDEHYIYPPVSRFNMLFENFSGNSYGSFLVHALGYPRFDIVDALLNRIGKNAPVHDMEESANKPVYTGHLDLQGLVNKICAYERNHSMLIPYAVFFIDKYSLEPNQKLVSMLIDWHTKELIGHAIGSSSMVSQIGGSCIVFAKEALDCIMKNKKHHTAEIFDGNGLDHESLQFIFDNFKFDHYGTALIDIMGRMGQYGIERGIGALRLFIEKTGGMDACVHFLPSGRYEYKSPYQDGSGSSARQIIEFFANYKSDGYSDKDLFGVRHHYRIEIAKRFGIKYRS